MARRDFKEWLEFLEGISNQKGVELVEVNTPENTFFRKSNSLESLYAILESKDEVSGSQEGIKNKLNLGTTFQEVCQDKARDIWLGYKEGERNFEKVSDFRGMKNFNLNEALDEEYGVIREETEEIRREEERKKIEEINSKLGVIEETESESENQQISEGVESFPNYQEVSTGTGTGTGTEFLNAVERLNTSKEEGSVYEDLEETEVNNADPWATVNNMVETYDGQEDNLEEEDDEDLDSSAVTDYMALFNSVEGSEDPDETEEEDSEEMLDWNAIYASEEENSEEGVSETEEDESEDSIDWNAIYAAEEEEPETEENDSEDAIDWNAEYSTNTESEEQNQEQTKNVNEEAGKAAPTLTDSESTKEKTFKQTHKTPPEGSVTQQVSDKPLSVANIFNRTPEEDILSVARKLYSLRKTILGKE